MNISKTHIAFLLLTFRKSQIPQYLLDCANTWVNSKLTDATRESISSALATGKNILAALTRYQWLCPAKWRSDYALTINAFADTVDACDDLVLTIDEIEKIGNSFKLAYSAWCAD